MSNTKKLRVDSKSSITFLILLGAIGEVLKLLLF